MPASAGALERKRALAVLFAICWSSNYFAGLVATLLAAYLPEAVLDLRGRLDEATLGTVGAYVGGLFLVGWTIGGVAFGYLGDRVGRAGAFVGAFLLYGVFTLAAAFVEDWPLLVACRFVAGIGIGGALVTSAVLVAEAWPVRSRAVALGFLAAGFPIGIVSAGLVNLLVESWRDAFLVGILPVGLAVAAVAVLRDAGVGRGTIRLAQHLERHRVATLFRPPARRPFLVGATIFGSMLVGVWAVFSWLPTWVQSLIGFGRDGQAERGLLMMLLGGGGITGGLLSGFLANALGRRRSLLVCFAGAFVASFLLLKTNASFTPLVYAETAFLAVFFGVSQGILTAYVPELFPTAVRSTATGICFNAGRTVTAAAVFFVGVLVSVLGGYGNAVFVFSFTYVLGFVATLFGEETRGVSLR